MIDEALKWIRQGFWRDAKPCLLEDPKIDPHGNLFNKLMHTLENMRDEHFKRSAKRVTARGRSTAFRCICTLLSDFPYFCRFLSHLLPPGPSKVIILIIPYRK